MNNPRISVIITTYKRPFYVNRAFFSVLSQSYKASQIIIVNDDPSFPIDSSIFDFTDPPLIINHTQNLGASAARNTGLTHAYGEIICFLDDDDIWMPNYLHLQVLSLANTSDLVGFSYTHSVILNSTNFPISKLQPIVSGNIFDLQLISHSITNISCVAIKANVLKFVPEFDVKLPRGNDSDFIRQLSYFFHCVCVEECLVLYNFDSTLPRITSYSRNGLTKDIFSVTYRLRKYFECLSVRPIHLALLMRRLSYLSLRLGNFLDFCFYFSISCLPAKLLKSNLILKKIRSL